MNPPAASETPKRLRIVTITADEPHHRCLTSLLANRFGVTGAIVEPCKNRRQLLWQRKRYRSWGWFYYHYLRRTVTGLDQYRADFFGPKTDETALAAVPSITVDSINDPAAIKAVLLWQPTIVILCGTSIMHEEMRAACRSEIINVHGGFLPHYRGNHCFFFAMYEKKPKYLGSTIHYVDGGIDTGDIVENVQVPLLLDDTPETQYCRCEWEAFQRLAGYLERSLAGEQIPRRTNKRGREYRMRDRTPWIELKWTLRRLTGRR